MSETVKWLMQAAEEIRNEGHAGWGNTCEQAAERMAELERQLAELRAAGDSNANLNRRDFTIQKLKTAKGESHGEGLVLCYRGELFPFQVSTNYRAATLLPAQFDVSLEVGFDLDIREYDPTPPDTGE